MPPYLFDYHVHSNTSFDAINSVDEMCVKAIAQGISEICFTNHQEWRCVADGTYKYAMDENGWKKHYDEIKAARKKFPLLKIKFGVEIGYLEGHEAEIRAFCRKFPFDYVLGSVHEINGIVLPLEGSLDFSAEKADSHLKEYYRLIGRIAQSGICDCIAHIDIVQKRLSWITFPLHKKYLIPVVEKMRQNNVGFELNTKGPNYYQKNFYPDTEFLVFLNSSGIKKITIGSDSHDTDVIGKNLLLGRKALREAGFHQICAFKKRKPIYYSLEE